MSRKTGNPCFWETSPQNCPDLRAKRKLNGRLTIIRGRILTIFARFGFITTALLVAMVAGSLSSAPALAGTEKIILTEEEKAEKEARKACKIQICNVFRSKKATAETIACHIKKEHAREGHQRNGYRWKNRLALGQNVL